MNEALESTAEGTIQREAYEWLIRMDGDLPLDKQETEALHAWMKRSQAHRAEIKRLAGFWGSANVLTELAVPLQIIEKVTAPSISDRADRYSKVAWYVAAGACACLVIGVGLWRAFPSRNANGTYGTAVGQQQTLALVDGSSVEINTDSQVQVEYDKRLRKVRLLRGEAFFTVAPNPQRPFEVYAAGGVVRAVGTAFAVSLQGSGVSVTVAKGEVAVINGNSPGSESGSASPDGSGLVPARISLKAGQTAMIGGSTSPQTENLVPLELKRRLAWHMGYLEFTGQPLAEVVNEINRYSPVTLQIADPKLASLAIGGRFKVGDLGAVCDVLQTSFGIKAIHLDDRHIELESASP